MASGFAFVALFMTSWLKGVDRERLTPEQRGDAGAAVSRLRLLMDSPLALYALASLALNLSFAQVEASFVLVLRDYLRLWSHRDWLAVHLYRLCIIVVQAVLIKKYRIPVWRGGNNASWHLPLGVWSDCHRNDCQVFLSPMPILAADFAGGNGHLFRLCSVNTSNHCCRQQDCG